MRIVSNVMLIVSGVYLSLGLIYLRFWWAERARLSYLAFTISCFSYAIFAWFEIGMLRSQTPEEYLFYIWWGAVIGFVGITAFGWLAYIHLKGRKWLFVTHSLLRTLALILHLIMPNGIHFREITAVGSRTVLGETLSYPIGVPNPWSVLPQFCNVILIIFFLDTSLRCWRRGEHRQALTFGMGTLLFGTVTVFAASLILWGLLPFPLMNTFTVLFIVAAMLYELNYDMHRAAMLAETLEERDARLSETLEQLQLSAAAANVGMWIRESGDEKVWLSEKAVEIWGFPSGKQIKREDLIQHIHPADRELYITNLREIEEWKNEYQIEYRILLKDGNVQWIFSRGKVETVNGSRIIRGAIVDITKLKMAEETARRSDEQNTAIVTAIPDLIFIQDSDGVYLDFHAKNKDDLLVPPEEFLGKNMRDVLPSALAAEFFDSFERAAATRETQILEYNLSLEDGDQWFEARVVRMGDKFLSVVRDITRTKLAQEAVHDLSHRLMNAQEKERARLARELHDDLSQSLAMLAIQMVTLRNDPNDLEYVQGQLSGLISDVYQLAGDVRRISHELHPARLSQLGLEAALAGFCGEITAAYPLEIEFEAENLLHNPPDDISLCLYRVTQESLQNVVKHSKATSARVSINTEDGKIHLSISDNGKGFDTEATKEKESLGLISIDERVRAVEGQAKIISAVGEGTIIEVQVPNNDNFK
jgi:PAS domain S-box-containing protein